MRKIVDKNFVMGKIPIRSENSNKATFGKILNIAGSKNYIGAAYLSSISALKIGAGYVTLGCIEELVPIIASMSPEITFKPLKQNDGVIDSNNDIGDIEQYNVVSIGCGIGNTEETANFVNTIIHKRKKEQPMVLDADGINVFSTIKEDILINNAIITPHPKELSRLLHVKTEEITENREKYAVLSAQKYGCITVLKGHNTVITDGRDIYINTTGSSALAKAGSGDVLTGIISGLLAQKLSVINAAVLGVYLHGLAGDLAAENLTKYSVLATDIIKYLPFAIKTVIR